MFCFASLPNFETIMSRMCLSVLSSCHASSRNLITSLFVIYFVGKKEKITIKELLSILQITKQSLSRVLNQLVKEKYIILSIGDDKRTKNLSLTKKGHKLENELSTIQIKKIKKILKNNNEDTISGFKTLLYEMIDDKNKIKFGKLNY